MSDDIIIEIVNEPNDVIEISHVDGTATEIFYAIGEQGPAGPTGATGPTGPTGPQGASYTPGDPVYVIVRNATGSPLSKGTIVYVSGANGTHTQVTPALASSDATSARTLGWLAENISNNASGLCCIEGYVEGINTQGVTEGAQLYLSPTIAGGFTSTKPSAPNHMVYVGVCAKASAGNGKVFVKVQNGYELDELHDVAISSPTDNQVLTYEASTGLWKNKLNPADGVTQITTSAPLTGGTITSTGTIGLDQTALSITPSQVVGTAVITTDGRLSDNRTPIDASVTDAKITASGLSPSKITGTAVITTDGRLSDTRTPTDGSVTDSKITATGLSPSKITGTAVINSDSRLSDSRTPTGNAGGDLTGTYPNPTIAAGAIIDVDVSNTANIAQSKISGLVSDLSGKANLTGGNSFTGAQNITGSNAAITSLKVVPAASPSTDIFQIRNSADNANLFSIGSGGAITTASASTVNGLATFNNNISAFGTSQLWANQQLSLGVRNGVNYAGNLVQYSLNDTTVTGGVSARGLLFAGSTGFENNPTYNLSATNPFLTSSTAIFTVSTVQTYNPFAVGQKIIISGASQAQYNGAWISTAVGGSSGAWTVTIVAGGTTTPFTDGGAITATGTIALEPAGFFKQPSPGAVGLVIKGAGISSTATDIFRYVNSNGSVQTYITAAGDITAPAISAIWSITSSAQDISVNAMRARTSIASGYRANLQTWESSTTVLAGVNATGQIFTGRTSAISGATTATTAASASSTTVATFTVGTVSTVNPYAVGQVVTTAGFTAQTYFNSSSQTSGTFYVTGIGGSSGAWTITVLGSGFTVGSATVQGTITIPAQVSVTPYSAGTVGQIIRGATSQSANLQEWQDSAGSIRSAIDSTGRFNSQSSANLGGFTPGLAVLGVQTSSASTLVSAIRGAASQVQDLTQWQSSDGTVRGGRNANAQIYTGSTAPLTSSIGGTIQSIATGANPLVTMASNHNLVAGDLVTLSGTTNGTYDGTFVVSASTPASTTFNITTTLTTGQAAAGGTVVVPAQTSIVARSGATVALNVRGASNQTASFMEVQNSSATTLLRVNTSGYVVAPLGLIGGGSTQSTNTSSILANNTMYATAAGQIGLAVRAAATPTVNIFEIQDSSGSPLAFFNNVGRLAAPRVSFGGRTDFTGSVNFFANNSTTVAAIVQGASGQSVDLQQWQSWDGTTASIVARVDKNGAVSATYFGPSGTGLTGYVDWTTNSPIFQTGAIGTVGLIIRGFGTGGSYTQQANLVNFQTFNGTSPTTVATINKDGYYTGPGIYATDWGDSTNFQTAIKVQQDRNVQMFSGTSSYGGGKGVLGLANANTVPNTNPTGGGVLYVETGALKYRGTSGSAATIVNADGTMSGGGSFTGGILTGSLTLRKGGTTSGTGPLYFDSTSASTDVLGTPVTGAQEFDGTVFYATPNATPGRAVDVDAYYYTNDAQFTMDFTTSANARSILGAAGTAGLSVVNGTTYEYELYFRFSGAYGLTGSQTPSFGITASTISGSPVLSYNHFVDAGSNTSNYTSATTLSTTGTTTTRALTALSTGSLFYFVKARGIIRLTGTGSAKIYPSISMNAANADNTWTVPAGGVIFKITPIGNGTVTSIGIA